MLKYVTLGSIRWLGWVTFVLFLSCSVGALYQTQVWTSLAFLVFAMLGIYIITASYCKYAIDDVALYSYLTPLSWHHKMNWSDVKTVELGSYGTLVFYGASKRFVLPPVSYWSGNEKLAMHKRLVEQFELRKIVPVSSNTADYRFNKNVRVNNTANFEN